MNKFSKTTQILITVFGGWFGLHCYLNKQYGKGVLYTLTCGGLYIGWFYDIFKVITKKTTNSTVYSYDINLKVDIETSLKDELNDLHKSN